MKWSVIDSLSIHPHILNGLIAVLCLWQRALCAEANQMAKSSCKKAPWVIDHIPAQDVFLAVLQSDLAFKGRVVLLSRVLSIFVSRVDVQVAASTGESQSTGEKLMWRFGKTTQEHFITHSLTTKMVLPGAASQSTLDTLYPQKKSLQSSLIDKKLICGEMGWDPKHLPYWNHLVKLFSFFLNSTKMKLFWHCIY